jgi:triacylglycerol lipase
MAHLTAETRLNSRGYSGSLDLLAPDVPVLSQNAATQGAPTTFVLRAGEIHDWALGGTGDGAGYGSQIYQELASNYGPIN